jgi:phosphoribosylglycinamide formyltransferase 1
MQEIQKPQLLRLGVLISGSGTTLQNLADVIAESALDASIACVISSNPNAFGLQRAAKLGVPAFVVTRKECGNDPQILSHRLTAILKDHSVDLVIMAGFLCLWHIPPEFTGRVMNIHPALLPTPFGGPGMYGHRVHEAVIASGAKVSGCTVHFADNQYDHGPIIIQRTCPVHDDDTPDTLAHRVFEQECLAYPEAIRLFSEDRLRIAGNRVRILHAPPAQ